MSTTDGQTFLYTVAVQGNEPSECMLANEFGNDVKIGNDAKRCMTIRSRNRMRSDLRADFQQ